MSDEPIDDPVWKPERIKVLTEQQKRDFCALMLSRYGIGIDINNEMLPAFYITYLSASLSEKTSIQTREGIIQLMKEYAADNFKSRNEISLQTKQSIAEIMSVISDFKKDAADNTADIKATISEFKKDSAANVAKLETKQYRFDNPETAFYFALGKYGIIASVAMVLVFIGFLVVYLSR